MRNLLALIALVIIGFAVIGWHQGWYQLGVTKTNDGNLHVETNVYPKKIGDDSGAFLKRGGELVGNQLEKTSQPSPAATPGPQDNQKVTVFGFDLSPPEKK